MSRSARPAPGVAAFVAAVRDTIARRGMDVSGGVLAAVSGGPDSVAMLAALHRLGVALEVAHFDHGVREGSADDAAYVEGLAGRLGLPVHLGRPPSGAVRARPGESPEEALRRERLAFLEETARSHGLASIATGHTRDDQAETVLMRLVAGAGRRGLSGIPPVRGPYIRPLIDLGRADTEAACRALRLRPRRDPTNADPSLLRNAVRAELIPFLAGRFNRRVAEALARAADLLRDEDALLDAIAADALEPEAAGGSLRIKAADLALLHPAVQRRVLRRMAPLDADATERVRRLAATGETGDQIFLAGGLNARLEYGWLVVGPAPSSPVRPGTVRLTVPGTTEAPGWKARITAVIVVSPPDSFPDGATACALDADAAGEPLVVRVPRTGDRFRPFGMARSRKLGDFFTDAKVRRAERAAAPVVAGPHGIVWVVGHRIEDRCKVERGSKRILLLGWESV